MYLVGRIARDSDYDTYEGLSEIRLFQFFEAACEFVLQNLDVSAYERLHIHNPAYSEWRKTDYAEWRKRGYFSNKPPPTVMIDNPNPYTEVYVRNPWAVLGVEADGTVADAITYDVGTSMEVNHSLFQYEDSSFQIPIRR